MAAGETATPILRPGIAPQREPEAPPSYSYGTQMNPPQPSTSGMMSNPYSNTNGGAGPAMAMAAGPGAGAGGGPPAPAGGGPDPDGQMQQINLASPPAMPSNLRNADFF